MFEVLLVVVVLGLLAALITPTINRFFRSTSDVTKTLNAKQMTEFMETAYNAGVDTTGYADAASAIAALKGGIILPAVVPGGAQPQLKLKEDVNPAAYNYTAATANSAAKFTAILGDDTQRP
jgi:type II secretory pathway pseudopilin PulG